jgi:signal transduction histidine kinase
VLYARTCGREGWTGHSARADNWALCRLARAACFDWARPFLHTIVVTWLLAAVWLGCSVARAEAPVQVGHELRGLAVGRLVSVLEDPNGALTIARVSSGELASRFVASEVDALNFGFTTSSYWLRFETENHTAASRSWLLEVGYPHLDHVTLYVPRADGSFEQRETGDTLPFARRDVAYRNFLFSLDEPARSRRTYYLRMASAGALNLPLTAWTTTQFMEHQHLSWAALCAYYGIVLIMAFYNACIYILAKQGEFLRYVGFVLALGLLQLTLAGHTFQFLLPNDSWVANRILPASIGLVVLTGGIFSDHYLGKKTLHRAFVIFAWLSGLGTVASFVLPYAVMIRLLIPLAIVGCTVGMAAATMRMRMGDRRGQLYVVAWGIFMIGAIATMLRAQGLLPVNFATTWSMQIGSVIQLALLSSMLADNINSMRADLALLNGQLSGQVSALREALTRAEDATARAEKATRVKDEFMATMSHEFRTPLNAIINIPQGLLDYFPQFRGAACTACDARFELEEKEPLPDGARCPECGKPEALVEKQLRRYVGAPEHTATYLGKIERSGQHLLQVVNGILDFSKLESGHFELARAQVELSELLHDVMGQMAPLAEAAGVRLTLGPCPETARLYADELRVRQVLINLLGNAIKFSNGQGTVTLEVVAQSTSYLFAVRDQGIGIAKENLESVFGSFEQVDKGNTRRYGGTGLGLSIARSLVQMHGGSMWVESTLGHGSSFYFRIPRQSSNEHASEAPLSPGPHDTATVVAKETWA